jgi:hypothetical protein
MEASRVAPAILLGSLDDKGLVPMIPNVSGQPKCSTAVRFCAKMAANRLNQMQQHALTEDLAHLS